MMDIALSLEKGRKYRESKLREGRWLGKTVFVHFQEKVSGERGVSHPNPTYVFLAGLQAGLLSQAHVATPTNKS